MTAGRPVRAAVIGLGDVGRLHVQLLDEMAEYELVAVADADPDAPQRLPVDAAGARCTSLSEALERASPDVVVVATPPATHTQVVAEALRADVHVYCEKPLALAAREAASLAALARERDRRLHVGMQWRHRAGYAEAGRAIAQGAIGEIRRCEALACDWFRSARHFRRRPWRGRWAGSGGSVLMSQAIHQVDVLCWLLGEPVEVVAEIGRARDAVEVEDQVVADVRFARGATARVVARSTDFAGTEVMLVHGDRGTIELTRERVRMVASEVAVDEAWSGAPRTERILGEPQPASSSMRELLAASHRAFLRTLGDPRAQQGESARDAVRTLELVNGIYYSALTARQVTLPVPAREYSELLHGLARGSTRVPRRTAAYLPAVRPAPGS